MTKEQDNYLPEMPKEPETPIEHFLSEATADVSGAKIQPVIFEALEKDGFKVEWALKGTTLIVHIYKAQNVKWTLNYAKRLYALMDEHASGEMRDIGYEDMVDSWYIKSEEYSSGKLDPNISAKTLCGRILDELAS